MESIKNFEWKESFFKSIVYRIITVILGFITAYIVTGDMLAAFGIASLTEIVQFINYFFFEVAWTNLRTKKRIEEELRQKLVDLEIRYDSILELAFEMSQIDTFIKEVYDSTDNFFKSILENEELSDLYEDIAKYYASFKNKHQNRNLETFGPETETESESKLALEAKSKAENLKQSKKDRDVEIKMVKETEKEPK